VKTQVKRKLLTHAEIKEIARVKLYEEYYQWVADNAGCHINARLQREAQFQLELNRLNNGRSKRA